MEGEGSFNATRTPQFPFSSRYSPAGLPCSACLTCSKNLRQVVRLGTAAIQERVSRRQPLIADRLRREYRRSRSATSGIDPIADARGTPKRSLAAGFAPYAFSGY
jgi:hypothetical protein